MIELMIILAYMVPALSVYRRSGYVWNQSMLNGHDFQNICDVCTPDCKNCGGRRLYHSGWSCNNYEPQGKIIPFHISSLFVAIPFALLWPLTLLGFGIYSAVKIYGIKATFLKPPPVIESKQEKMKRKLAQAEAELSDTNKRLKELGIDL